MSEEQDKPEEPQPRDEPKGPTGGERLAVARREKQITVLEVAKELHLDEYKVRALERNEFDVLGAPVFAKGHLRKYAQLVGVNDDDVFADYYQLTRSEGVPPIVVGRPRIDRELSPGPWIAAIIFLIATAVAYWWFGVREIPVADPVPPPAEIQEPRQSGDSAVPEDELIVTTAQPDAEPMTELVGTSASVETSAVAAEPVSADGQLRLTVSFSGNCWTEISDAGGSRLYFGMGRAGQRIELSGQPPLSVLFGNGDNVSLRVNGSDYVLPSSDPGNQTVRLSLVNS